VAISGKNFRVFVGVTLLFKVLHIKMQFGTLTHS
jgi:hypothetical protein